MKKIKSYEYEIIKDDFVNAGIVSSDIKGKLKKIGITNHVLRRISVASYEGEMNVIIHSYGGHIILELYEDRVILIIKDKGPGINNVELAMTEGYSTATSKIREMGFGAGMGLPNIKNCSDIFNIKSREKGTEIEATIFFKQEEK